MVLRPPVEPMLAQARESVPGPGVLPGGLVFEAKFDGYRALLFTPNRIGGAVLVQSRRGSLIQRHFPDLVAAARQLPDGLVLEGELVVWSGDRLSFEALQRRAVSGARTVDDLAARMPAHFIAFDVLQADSQELLTEPYERRRDVLESQPKSVVLRLEDVGHGTSMTDLTAGYSTSGMFMRPPKSS